MDLSKKEDVLARFPLFSGLDPEHLRTLASIAVPKEVQKKAVLFREGEEARGFFLLITGKVKLIKVNPAGKEQILHFFGPGEPFGETEEIRLDSFVMRGKDRMTTGLTRAAKPGHHFVGDEKRFVGTGDFADALQPTLGLWDHPCRTLHERFVGESCVVLALLLSFLKCPFHLTDAFPLALAIFSSIGALGLRLVERTTITIGCHYFVRLE